MAEDVLVSRPGTRMLPTVSLGPYGLLEAVPWLMFAAAMRFLGYSNAAFALPALILSSLALFLAFLLCGPAHDRIRRRNDAARQIQFPRSASSRAQHPAPGRCSARRRDDRRRARGISQIRDLDAGRLRRHRFRPVHQVRHAVE